MSSDLEQIPSRPDAPEIELGRQIEDLATRLVLGGLNGEHLNVEQGTALLASLREQAASAGRTDVARIAAESIEALPGIENASGLEAMFSASIIRMQQALSSAAPGTEAAPAAAPPSMGEDPELVREFIIEARDHLTQVEIHMMTLEKDPGEAEAINTVFRGFHTIKGVAGFLDITDVREVAHEVETLLDLAREHKLRITPAVADTVLAAADFLKSCLQRLETGLAGSDPGPVAGKQALLERIRRGATAAPEAAGSLPGQAPPEAAASETTEASGPEAARRPQIAEARAVKVETAKLDILVDMAGEMVIAQSMVRHHPELASLRNTSLLRNLAQLARITGELQKTAMSMRMVPVGGLFQKMNRLVRDLARKTGRQAELDAIGGETELDRNVVEELADPLMHMVRNAVDHGLETPEERLACGKHPTGRVRLRASHQAGHIIIEVADDGRGLARDNLLATARRMGLVEEGAKLSDSEIFSLIFHPGFSTAAKVTDVSGRGVGMDVVKRQIQKLRGRVDIESAPGQGTAFFLRLPLTLAMIDGLVVGVGGERYILPIFSVREMLRPGDDKMFTVEGKQEMALVRESLLPVVRLYQRFGVRPRSELATEGLLVVAEAGGKRFCLLVDELIGKQEVVIKCLGETMRDIPGIAGGAILGDGRVGLIVDLEGIFRMAGK